MRKPINKTMCINPVSGGRLVTDNLSEVNYWESVYNLQKYNNSDDKLAIARKIFGKNLAKHVTNCFSNSNFYAICKNHLPKSYGFKLLEVGSAPGSFLVQFSRVFGCEPFGIEYTEAGMKVNREIFKKNKLDPDNIFFTNFFSDDFQSAHRDSFDVVMSRGFIEHFNDVSSVIKSHKNLAAKDGICLISLPNLNGINYFLANFFKKDIIKIHNLSIMDKIVLQDICERNGLKTLYCNYYGMFDFNLFSSSYGLKSTILDLCHNSQGILNLFFNCFCKNRTLESKYYSPYLLYIGKKIA